MIKPENIKILSNQKILKYCQTRKYQNIVKPENIIILSNQKILK